ncbi:hypothetical protein ACFVYA_18305 [Amycolatopsis sp. NPDC058278]|uniref:hypothetical protein n=1 Tax=Amycolatopsis sp. NPDC058278 TaxID=3346417 RepID=UPI0036DD1F9D
MRDTRPVEQILFGLTTQGGIGITKASNGLSTYQRQRWDHRLDKYNRLNPTIEANGAWLPPKAFSYFEFDNGDAAVLTRFDNDPDGRNSSHALVGPAEVLAQHAMFLSHWDGWRMNAHEPLCIGDPGVWDALHDSWLDEADEAVRLDPGTLELLLETVLSEESPYVTIFGHRDPLPFLTIAREILDPVVSTPGERFEWTFSTYEDSDTRPEASPDKEGAPRFWCVLRLPESGETTRRRIGTGREPAASSFSPLARKLVDRYLAAPTAYHEDVLAELSEVRWRRQRLAHLTHAVQAPVQAPPVAIRETGRLPQPSTSLPHDPQLATEPGVRTQPLAAPRSHHPGEREQEVARRLQSLEWRIRRQSLLLVVAVAISVLMALLTFIFWPSSSTVQVPGPTVTVPATTP